MKTLILVSAILIFLGLGCSKFNELVPGSKGNSSSSSSKAGTDPKQEVIDASKKFIALPHLSAKMDGMGQTEIKSQVDYLAPDRYHIMYLGGTGAGMEMIIIGKDFYMKTAGKWMKSPGANTGAQSIPTLRDSFTDEGLQSLTDVRYEGPEMLDGKPANVYNYNNVTPKGNY